MNKLYQTRKITSRRLHKKCNKTQNHFKFLTSKEKESQEPDGAIGSLTEILRQRCN